MKRYLAMLAPLFRKFIDTAEYICMILLLSLDNVVLPKRSLCISLGDGEISIAYGFRILFFCRMRGFKRIEMFRELIVPDHIAALIESHTQGLKAYRSSITLSIPLHWVLFRTTEFPNVVKSNLEDVVSYELDRLTPFSPGLAYYDFMILDERDGRVQIALSAARTKPIDGFLKAFSGKGLIINKITLNALGLAAIFRRESKLPDSIFVAPHQNGFEGGLISRGTLSLAFTGEYKGKEKNEAIAAELLPVMTMLADEKRSFEILLLPDGNTEIEMGSVASHPVRIVSPRFVSDSEERGYTVYSALGGMTESLKQKGRGFNLLSRGSRPLLKTSAALTSVLLLIGIVTGGLYYYLPLNTKSKRVQEIDRRIKMSEAEVKKVQSLRKESELLNNEIIEIQGFRNKRPLVVDTLKKLTIVVPKTAWLTTIKITDKEIYMGGYAADPSALLSKIGTLDPFQKVEFASPVIRDSRTGTYNFSIKMESKDGGKVKINEQKK